MLNSFSVTIGNEEYQAVGEEAKIRRSAKLLNEVMAEFNAANSNSNLTSLERTVYVALNIADMNLNDKQFYNSQLNEITTEIQNITTYIKNFLVD